MACQFNDSAKGGNVCEDGNKKEQFGRRSARGWQRICAFRPTVGSALSGSVMPIPALDTNGLLPPGLHSCTLHEIRERFGSFQGSELRYRLFERLESFVREAKAAGIVRSLIINGSFVTGKPRPNDIDLAVILAAGHDFSADLGASQYNVVDRHRVRRAYGLDVFVAEEGSVDYVALLRFFQRVRLQPGLAKDILRVEL